MRKVHNLILLPGISEAEKLSERLEQIGNLHSDGRPILGLDSRAFLRPAYELAFIGPGPVADDFQFRRPLSVQAGTGGEFTGYPAVL